MNKTTSKLFTLHETIPGNEKEITLANHIDFKVFQRKNKIECAKYA